MACAGTRSQLHVDAACFSCCFVSIFSHREAQLCISHQKKNPSVPPCPPGETRSHQVNRGKTKKVSPNLNISLPAQPFFETHQPVSSNSTHTLSKSQPLQSSLIHTETSPLRQPISKRKSASILLPSLQKSFSTLKDDCKHGLLILCSSVQRYHR